MISMDCLPKELLNIISQYCRPGLLSLICKYCDIYNEVWYYQYLVERYDETEFVGTDFTYKELCFRSLLEGDIYTDLGIKIMMQGIKCKCGVSTLHKYYVLKFNGILYECLSAGDTINIIDHNVIDISGTCYIKKDALYLHNSSEYQTISFSTMFKVRELQFIHGLTRRYCQFYTEEAIYFNHYDMNRAGINKFIITDKICKAYTISHHISLYNTQYITYILTSKNTLLIYRDKNFTQRPKIIHKVTDLGQNYVCINNKYYYFNPHNIYFYFNDDQLILLNCAITSSISLWWGPDLLLINKKITSISHDGIFTALKQELQVKNITGDSNGIMVIK